MSLDCIMKPRSVAVIGASSREHTIGADLMKRLTEYGFTGEVYPVNPKGGKICGRKVYTDLREIPGVVDLAIVVVNARFVLSVVDQCHEKGVKGLVVITAGFKETGAEGLKLEQELLAKVKGYGMTMVGPNCLGVVNTDPAVRLDACFAESLPVAGNVGFVSQSGALGGGILNILKDLNIGFAQFVSIGNQADVNAETAIEYWEHVPAVKQILLYMESVRYPENFRKLATRVSKVKPILALKAGRSAAGASAASSHTGSLAGADRAADALLTQSGVIRERSLKDLFATAKVFAHCPIPQGDRVAIVTNSGGPAIMATDAICEHGMQMAKLSDATKEKLRSFLPAAASVKNPVDMIASAPLEHYRQTMDTVLSDSGVDMIIVIYLPFLGLKDTDVAKAVEEMRAKYPTKPIVGVFMTESRFFNELPQDVTVPFFMYSEEAADGLARLNRQRIWMQRPAGKFVTFDNVKKDTVANIFAGATKENRHELTTSESLKVLEAYGVRVCRSGIAHSEDEAVALAHQIGWPIVMKITSTQTSHKSDVGGVRVGIVTEGGLRREYQDLMEKLEKAGLKEGLEGVIIQEMVQGKRELVCGISQDPLYGPMVMFGLGGIFVEVLKDVAFRLAPLADTDAEDLMSTIRSADILGAPRGLVAARKDLVRETLLRLSQLVEDFPVVSELDINPLIVSDKNGEPIAVDARIKVKLA